MPPPFVKPKVEREHISSRKYKAVVRLTFSQEEGKSFFLLETRPANLGAIKD